VVWLLRLGAQRLLDAAIGKIQLLCELFVESLDFLFLRINDLSVVYFELLFNGDLLLRQLCIKLLLFLLEVINLLLQNLDMKLELLFCSNVVSDIRLVLLKLLFVLFWRKVDRVKGRCEFGSSAVFARAKSMLALAVRRFFVLFALHLH